MNIWFPILCFYLAGYVVFIPRAFDFFAEEFEIEEDSVFDVVTAAFCATLFSLFWVFIVVLTFIGQTIIAHRKESRERDVNARVSRGDISVNEHRSSMGLDLTSEEYYDHDRKPGRISEFDENGKKRRDE